MKVLPTYPYKITLAISNEAASLSPWKIEIFLMKSSVQRKTKAIAPLYIGYSLILKTKTAIVKNKAVIRVH